MAYLSLSQLQREQNRLQLSLIKYSLDEEWRSSELIANLRAQLYPRMPHGLFDPQDLEHQVLFRLTTYSPDEITDQLINEVIEEQLLIIENRLENVPDREYLFRGLNPRSKDLNIENRLELKHEGGRLYATGFGRTIDVEFKKITDDSIIKLFTEKLHYIHSGRHQGDAFGFYFAGDDLPWGVETIEPSLGVKKYKRDALLAHGIDPNKAVEVTRLYLLPGSPKNSISILDGLVSKYYKEQGMEAMYTTTMPMYAKTKGATTAGGMRNVLLVKEQSHKFKKETIGGRTVFVHDVTTKQAGSQGVATHPSFPTLLTVETFMILNKNRDLIPLSILKNKVIFINPAHRRSEKMSEVRFNISSLSSLYDILQKNNAQFIGSSYISDSFWGHGSAQKLRLRKIVEGINIMYESSCKYRISDEEHVRTLVNDILYSGQDQSNALAAIKIADKAYKQENSYEKIRQRYQVGNVAIYVDIYPFGSYIKLLGSEKDIMGISDIFGYSGEDDISIHADDIYLKWSKQKKMKELWDVRFGLEKDNE